MMNFLILAFMLLIEDSQKEKKKFEDSVVLISEFCVIAFLGRTCFPFFCSGKFGLMKIS